MEVIFDSEGNSSAYAPSNFTNSINGLVTRGPNNHGRKPGSKNKKPSSAKPKKPATPKTPAAAKTPALPKIPKPHYHSPGTSSPHPRVSKPGTRAKPR